MTRDLTEALVALHDSLDDWPRRSLDSLVANAAGLGEGHLGMQVFEALFAACDGYSGIDSVAALEDYLATSRAAHLKRPLNPWPYVDREHLKVWTRLALRSFCTCGRVKGPDDPTCGFDHCLDGWDEEQRRAAQREAFLVDRHEASIEARDRYECERAEWAGA